MVTAQPDQATINRAKLVLFKAIAENRIDNVKKIISANFPVNEEIGPGGLTLLMHCAQFGSVECLDILI